MVSTHHRRNGRARAGAQKSFTDDDFAAEIILIPGRKTM
jgi:hypothetical protein